MIPGICAVSLKASLSASRILPARFGTSFRASTSCRAIHSSRNIHFKQKLDSNGKKNYNGDNKFKHGTPNKRSGSIHNFMITASYSPNVRNAPGIMDTAQGGVPYNLDSGLETGRVYQYPAEVSKKLAKLGSYQRGQRHELFREHCSIIRPSSQELLELVNNAANKPSRDNRVCILGDLGIGKTTLLAQAHAFAAEKEFIIVPLKRAEDLIDGNTDAIYSKKHDVFAQPMFIKRWMKHVAICNKKLLNRIKPSDAVTKSSGAFQPHSSIAMKSLYSFLIEGKSRRDAFDVMNDFLLELEKQTESPVLFTVDNFNAWTDRVVSENRDTENKPIKISELQIPSYFYQFLSGERSFQRGMVLATTSGRYPLNDTIKAGMGLNLAPHYVSLKQYDPKVASYMKGVKPLVTERLSKDETRSLLEYYQASGLFHNEVTEEFVSEKYFLSGCGNPRSLLESCVPASY